jgi:hypothetical protein
MDVLALRRIQGDGIPPKGKPDVEYATAVKKTVETFDIMTKTVQQSFK